MLHGWNLTETNEAATLETYAFYSLLYLIKSWGEHGRAAGTEIVVLSGTAHIVSGTETVYPQQSLLWGPVRVSGQEYPGLKCRNIDLTAADYLYPKTLTEKLMREIDDEQADQFCAYRGLYRWVPDFSKIDTGRQTGPAHTFKSDSIYLITGGTGGLGLFLHTTLPPR